MIDSIKTFDTMRKKLTPTNATDVILGLRHSRTKEG